MKLAVICVFFNEEVLIPQFLNYYAPLVETVYLFDNESTDHSAEIAKRYKNVVLEKFSTNESFSDTAQHFLKQRKRAECIGRYDYTITVDCDEFVVPKSGGTLSQVIQSTGCAEAYGTQGFHMFQAHNEEGPYDASKSMLQQRQWGVHDSFYSKPVIVRPESALAHSLGCHYFLNHDNSNLKTASLTHFYLLHYTGFDETTFVQRGMTRAARLSVENRRNGWGIQYFDGREEVFRDRFKQFSTSERLERVLK